MISRIYVAQESGDSREKILLKSWRELGLSGKPSAVSILDSYILDSDLTKDELDKAGRALANSVVEEYFVNELPTKKKFSYCVEIGFLPGVTDNVGNSARETLQDLLDQDLKVYSSKAFLISGKLGKNDAEKIASSMYNPLIERAYIATGKELAKVKTLPLKAPVVKLAERKPVIKISLNVPDAELEKIGKEGIMDPDGTRRGPLALDLESMKTIRKYFKELGRDPTDVELESLAQTWSEHCKHTIFADPIDEIKDGLYKTYIKGATNLIRQRKGSKDFCVSVFSDNSGAIAFDDEFLITHKVETHNSPSALDPFGGAITGIVGVNRDTMGFGLGAKPVGNVYGFCVGDPADKRPLYRGKNKQQKMLSTKRIMDGVVKGINVGGNCSGIPTVSGFIRYEDRYRGKPLVFAGTVGIIPRKVNGKLSHIKKAEPGDYAVMLGGRVGADGIHGATFSSVTMDSTSPATAVQIGDPITQKKMSDALVKEARGMNLYDSITDNGAGGLSCSVAEMAKESGGVKVDLEKVPLKYPGLRPWETWISESQERMTLAVPKKKWEVFRRLMENRGVEATIVGEFTGGNACQVSYEGKKIMNMDMKFLHDGLPSKKLKTVRHEKKYKEPKLPAGSARTQIFEKLFGTLNLGSFAFISEQYDHEVQGSSVLKPVSGAGRVNTEAQVFRPVLGSPKGAVLSMALYPFYGDISTYHMAGAAIDSAIRSAVCAGGSLSRLALLDNFCWCSSNEPERLGELKDAVKACYDYAVGYETPFISGKDSMFNDFKGYDEKGNPIKISIPPTLLISAIGVMDDISKTVSPEFKSAGDLIFLLGETNDELGAGEYYRMLASEQKKPFRSKLKSDTEVGDAIGNNVPQVNWKTNTKTYRALEKAIAKDLIASAISVSSGGLAIALAKSAVGGMLGCNASVENLPGNADTVDAKLFSESQGRAVVSINPKDAKRFEKIMKENGAHFAKIGVVSKNSGFTIDKAIKTDVKKLHAIYHKFSDSQK